MSEKIKVIVRLKPLQSNSESCLLHDDKRISVLPNGISNPKVNISFNDKSIFSRNEPIILGDTPSKNGTIRTRLSFSAKELQQNTQNEKLSTHTAPINLFPKETKQTTKNDHNITKKRSKKRLNTNNTNDNYQFQFDKVFSCKASQDEIYTEIKPFVSYAIKGYNTSIFAFGQSGSGKTYTMMGDHNGSNIGIIPKAIETIFNEIQTYKDCKFNLTCSYVELHLDQFTDLLDPNSDPDVQKKMLPQQVIDMERKKKIEIRARGKDIFLSGSKTLNTPISTYSEAIKLIQQGQRCRSIAKTSLNNHSSRSHAIITITIEKIDSKNTKTRGKIHLIDLAGNERLSKSKVTGDTMKETQNINASLEALANVLSGLSSSKNNLIRYRDSKLTRFLQDSLGGNSKTCFVVNIRSDIKHSRETIQSLKYGQRAKMIKNTCIINQSNLISSNINSEEYNKLYKELKSLKELLVKEKNKNENLSLQVTEYKNENNTLKKQISHLSLNYKNEISQYQKKIDNLVFSQSTQLAENRYQYIKLQNNILCYRKQIYDLTCESAHLQQTNYLLSSSLQQTKGEINILSDNTEKLLKQRSNLENKLVECTKRLNIQQDKYKKLINDKKTLNSSVIQDSKIVKNLEQENEKLVKEIENITNTIKELEKNNKDNEDSLLEDITELKKELKEIKDKPIKENKKLLNEIDNLKKEQEESLKKIKILERENRYLQRDSNNTGTIEIPIPNNISNINNNNNNNKKKSSSPKEAINSNDDSFSINELSSSCDSPALLSDLDDEFELPTLSNKKPRTTKRKLTPKIVGRKRKSADYFDSIELDQSPSFSPVTQVNPLKKRKLNHSGLEPLSVNNSDKSEVSNRKKQIFKNFISNAKKQKPQMRLEIPDDKENIVC